MSQRPPRVITAFQRWSKPMDTLRIFANDIVIGERHRALSDDAVARLSRSIAEIGLKYPISVRVVDEMEIDGALVSGVPVLVAGAHRLAAVQALGWTHIDCIEVDDDPVTAELWELAENLHRHDLTKEQRDMHIRRYVELLTERAARIVPQTAEQIPAPRGRPKSIITQVAEATGLSDDTIRRAVNPRPPQPIEVKPARSREEIILAEANAIISAWNRASPEAREIALQEIDTPVFDSTRAA